MPPLKITIHGPNGTYTYDSFTFPRIGDKVMFPFANITGTVAAVEWLHTNEVIVTVKPANV